MSHFGTSIPINKLKTYATFFYVDSLVISFAFSFFIDFKKVAVTPAVAEIK